MFVGGYVSEHETTSVIVEHENIGTIRKCQKFYDSNCALVKINRIEKVFQKSWEVRTVLDLSTTFGSVKPISTLTELEHPLLYWLEVADSQPLSDLIFQTILL